MKKTYVLELPTCNIPGCKAPARYDVPTRLGPWGNICGTHYDLYASRNAETLGFELIIREPTPPRPEAEFQSWLKEVDKELSSLCGLDHESLPDQTWRQWFEDLMPATDAAETALENVMEDEEYDGIF